MSGEGPVFHRFGGRVRYLRADLDAWAATAGSTARAGAGRPAIRSTSNARLPGARARETRTGFVFHHPDGEDVAVRVLPAIAFPEA